jgi:hypothetical protein
MIALAADITVVSAAGASSVWSASDAAAAPGGMALSNGGLTVAPTTTSWSSIRTTISQSSGKLYVEFKNGPTDATGAMMIGAGSSSMDIGTYLGNSSYGFGFFVDAGNIFINMGAGAVENYGTSQTPAANDVWALAIDLTSGKVWLAQNNVWFGGGNPATGANPAMTYIPANAAPLFPALSFNGSPFSVWTLQATAASQTYAAPSGFSAWDPPAVTTGSAYGKLAYGKGQYSRAPVDDLAGNLAPVIALSADISITAATALAGDLAPSIALTGDLTVTAATALAGDLAPSVTFGGVLNSIELFAGDLAPAVAFVGDLDIGGAPDLAGNLIPLVTFAGDLTTTDLLVGDLAPSVMFAGALTSLFGLTGDLAPPVALSADLTVTPSIDLAGDLAPTVSFAADMTVVYVYDLVGDLAPDVTFAADLLVMVIHDLAGDLAFQIDLEASLGGDWLIAGDMSLGVDFGAEFTSGPLWEAAEPCPPPPWDEAEACPPTLWTPTLPPNWELPGVPQGWGMGAYGVSVYQPSSTSPWLPPDQPAPPPTWTPSAPPANVDWQDTEPCDG